MKTLEHKTYYEVLEVPADAGECEIKRAYHEALATYDYDALVTYSLFSDQQRAKILRMIECAFDTLINEEKRSQYNRELLTAPSGARGMTFGRHRNEADPLVQALRKSKADSLQAWVRAKSGDKEIKETVEKILGKERICGKDLKKLRSIFGIGISEFHEITRISSSMITHIEQDRFKDLPAELYLKRFLRSYAELLEIDSRPIVAGYLKNMMASADAVDKPCRSSKPR
jgi:curved DNA-binding protein CbpA